jgi:hypothetical protein
MTGRSRNDKVALLNRRQRKSGKRVSMSGFMVSQVKGLLSKASEDMANLAVSNSDHAEVLLGAVDDLAANLLRPRLL